MDKLYPKNLSPEELEPHFSKHMMAMTAENLHSKAEIAEQLAHRDQIIDKLKKEIEYLNRKITCGHN